MLEEHDETSDSNISIIAAALAGLALLGSTVAMIVLMICLNKRTDRTDANYLGCVGTAQVFMTILSSMVFIVVAVDTARWIQRRETMEAWSAFDDCLVDSLSKVQEEDLVTLEEA